jgi:hypothetical protein
MMCQICRICKVGQTYALPNGLCEDCGCMFENTGTYLGWSDDKHLFRVHNSVCPKCGYTGKYALMDCDDFDGINVTEDFQLMLNTKDSHWVGRDAKRKFEKEN